MLVVADINTIWRSRPFEALADQMDVLGLAPQDRILALRSHQRPWGVKHSKRGKMDVAHAVLPLGWASRNSRRALPKLWDVAKQFGHANSKAIQALITTSPHYLPLVREVAPQLPVFYYCSDDYRNYRGWSTQTLITAERELVRIAKHSFFVSKELRDRAVREYEVPEDRTSISMNATEDGFCTPIPNEVLCDLIASSRLRRPIAGVVGGVNERLDFSLLRKVSEIGTLGTLLFIGAIAPESLAETKQLQEASDKVVFLGAKPHEELPRWLQSLDVALIPYRSTEFNRFCSPMRLFDHLSAGRPIIATTACMQVSEFVPLIEAVDDSEFVNAVTKALGNPQGVETRRFEARKHTWQCRARIIRERLNLPPAISLT